MSQLPTSSGIDKSKFRLYDMPGVMLLPEWIKVEEAARRLKRSRRHVISMTLISSNESGDPFVFRGHQMLMIARLYLTSKGQVDGEETF